MLNLELSETNNNMVDKNFQTIIDNSLKNDNLSHCYLLVAERNINIDDSILYLINKANNLEINELNQESLPPSVIYINDDLDKDTIIETLRASSLASYNTNETKFIVIKHIDKMSLNALNSLLKNIEEPSPNTCFILTTSNPNKVLNTIRSRSTVVLIHAPKQSVLEADLLNILNLKEYEAWFYSNIFADIQETQKYLDIVNFNIVDDLIKSIEQSNKNKYFLYMFLCQFAKKDNQEIFEFLVRSLLFFFKFPWIGKNKINPYFTKLYDIIIKTKIDFEACFIAISDYLNSLHQNENYFLQTEKLLIKIMEAYE
ncbi:hypothetical protein [Mycoplasmopsis felifaucium]|uniref:hypothetical protein n=1 Tax=Mycoplasmopsis felifaucium TaxID=35768 RepID=UPI00068B953A|nr:hypothetical protein [Mycoplasmopsis felifaucium]